MPKRKQYKYTQENLEKALMDIKNGVCSVRAASLKYHVPRSTLFDKKTGRTALFTQKGPKPILTTEEEDRIAQHIIKLSKIGYYRRQKGIQLLAKQVLDTPGREKMNTKLNKNYFPGRAWRERFLKKHPDVAGLVNLCSNGNFSTSRKLREWFFRYIAYVSNEVDIGIKIFEEPMRIFCAEAFVFPIQKGVAELTVLICANAAGIYVSPTGVYPDKGPSCSNKVDSTIFHNWIIQNFYQEVTKKNIQLPVILLIEQSLLLSSETLDFCSDNQILLFYFPGCFQNQTQPLKVSLLGSLTKHFKQLRQGHNFTQDMFADTIISVWTNALKEVNIPEGFHKCGLYPIDTDKAEMIASSLNRSDVVEVSVEIEETPSSTPVPATFLTPCFPAPPSPSSSSASSTPPFPISPNFTSAIPSPGLTSLSASLSLTKAFPSFTFFPSVPFFSRGPPPDAAQAALDALECYISDATMRKFKRRIEIGQDELEIDELYLAWKKLRRAAQQT